MIENLMREQIKTIIELCKSIPEDYRKENHIAYSIILIKIKK